MIMKIEETLHKVLPNMQLLIIEADVDLKEHKENLKLLLKETYQQVQEAYKTEDLAQLNTIAHIRKAYQLTGKSPSRYRNSAEALMRRATQGKDIYYVNTLVDINNLLSLKYQIPIGSYDMDRVQGEVMLQIAEKGSSYQGIGKADINIEDMIVIGDDLGPFGSATSDSVRCMISEETKHMMMCFYLFDAQDYDIDAMFDDALSLLSEYTNAKNIQMKIVK